MNAVANHVMFASAYRQLNAVERAFVDATVATLEQTARRMGERIAVALHRPLPTVIVEQSRGLLDRPLVTAAITQRISEIAAENDLTIERWVKEVSAIAFSNIDDYFEEDELGQSTIDLGKCSRDAMAAIKTLDMEVVGDPLSANRRTRIKFQTHDKMSALKMLGEYMGALQSDNPHWRADIAKATAPVLPADADAQVAGDAYAAMIED